MHGTHQTHFLTPDQLEKQLAQQLHRCYLLYGNDPLLQQECLSAIHQAATAQTFDECDHFIIETKTDWQAIETAYYTCSLFTSQRRLQLTLAEEKLTTQQNEQLAALATTLSTALVLIVLIPHWNRALLQTTWFKALLSQGVAIDCRTPKFNQRAAWLVRRMAQLGLKAAPAILQLLNGSYEGHPLALDQTLKLLQQLYPDGELTQSRLQGAIYHAARFLPQQWLTALLEGNTERAYVILHRLRDQEVEPLLLLRSLQKNLLLLLHLKRDSATASLATCLKRHAVWESQRVPITQAVKRLTLQQLHHAVYQLAALERRLKQETVDRSTWEDLSHLTLFLSGKPLLEKMPYV